MRNKLPSFSRAVMAVLLQLLLAVVLFSFAQSAPQSAGPALSIGDVSASEGNSGTTEVLVAVTLTNPNSQNVTVNYQVINGTATRGSDYTVLSTSGTMTFFNGGATTQRIRITLVGDVTNEGDETFLVNLSNATNATITDNQSVGTILNDDGIVTPPNAPSNLNATPAGPSSIALTWTDNASDETGFKIERKTSSGVVGFSEIATLGSNVTSFTDTGLSASTTYVYRVRAYKPSVNSSYSNEATATTANIGAAPALTIADVSANEGNAGTTDILIAVTLNNSSGQTVSVNYQVVNGTATLGSDCTVLSTSGTMTFFNGGATTQRIRVTISGDATIEPDETVLVNLSNATNATLADNQGVGTIINDDGPLAPKPSNLSATATGNTTVTLTWADHPSDEDGYKIERSPAGSPGSFIEIATLGMNSNSFNDSGLGAGTTYVYRVRAFKAALNSGYTNEAAVTTTAVPPAAPNNLAVTATGVSTTTLTWTDNSNDEDGFKIERKPSGGSFVEITTVGGNINLFNDAGLSAGTAYTYRVRTFKASLHSNYTNEATATTAAAPPMAPNNLTATATGVSTTTLTWTDNSNDEDGFKIERKLSSSNFVEVATVGGNINSFDDSGLAASTVYVYRVRAFKAALTSSYSNETTVTTLAGGTTNLALAKPITASSMYVGRPATAAVDGFADSYWRSGPVSNSTVPSWLRVDLGAAMTVGKVTVKWRENYIAKKFEVQISSDDVNWTTMQTAVGVSGAQTLTFATVAARYVRLYFTLNLKGNYRIEEFEVYSGAVTKSHEEGVVANVLPETLGLEQNYPNPFSANGTFGNPGTRINFHLPQAAHVTLKVFTLTGAEVSTLVDAQYAAGKHTVVFAPKQLPSGTYFYVIQAGAARQVRRLMLVK